MPFRLSRRSFVTRAVSGTTLATLSGSTMAAAGTPTGEAMAGGQDGTVSERELTEVAGWSRLRQAVEALRSAAGAAWVGFARPDAGPVSRTVRDKLLEWPSITDFGAVPDDRTDNTAAIQRAIDAVHVAGGGPLCVPAGTFRIAACIRLRSGVALQGLGRASVLHCVNTRRGDAVRADGRASDRLSGIMIRDLAVVGDARFAGGKPDVVNGSGVLLVHADDCTISAVHVAGFSDNGIAVLNGNRNSIMNCSVERTAQGISFNASDMSVSGNVAIGNRIVDTGEYNGLHLEGGFGGNASGEVRHTTLSGNTVTNSWEAGINIELAPYTACIGNTVDRAGVGRTGIAMGVKVYGGYRSAICGNTIIGASGEGIVVGANSSECAIDGNVTAGNGGSLLLTDSDAQVSNDVAIGSNSFTEGDVRLRGNVRLRNRTFGFSFANRANPDPQTLDWYEEGRFAPVRGSGTDAWTVREARFTRIGNVVHVALSVEGRGTIGTVPIVMTGLPYDAAVAAPLAATWQADGVSNPPQGIVATASGRTITLYGPAGPNASAAARTPAATWRIILAGQYLTAG